MLRKTEEGHERTPAPWNGNKINEIVKTLLRKTENRERTKKTPTQNGKNLFFARLSISYNKILDDLTKLICYFSLVLFDYVSWEKWDFPFTFLAPQYD